MPSLSYLGSHRYSQPGPLGLRMMRSSFPVHTVAARHKVSPRYVQRLFDESGSTFTEYVMEQRLERAYRLLRDPRLADRTMTTIAFASGFNDLSHFQRRFRGRFGTPPSELRAAARTGTLLQ